MNKKSLICSNVFCRATVDVDENWEHKECGQAHPIEYKIQAAVEKKKLW